MRGLQRLGGPALLVLLALLGCTETGVGPMQGRLFAKGGNGGGGKPDAGGLKITFVAGDSIDHDGNPVYTHDVDEVSADFNGSGNFIFDVADQSAKDIKKGVAPRRTLYIGKLGGGVWPGGSVDVLLTTNDKFDGVDINLPAMQLGDTVTMLSALNWEGADGTNYKIRLGRHCETQVVDHDRTVTVERLSDGWHITTPGVAQFCIDTGSGFEEVDGNAPVSYELFLEEL